MSSHPTDYQCSVIGPLHKPIDQQSPNSRSAVNCGGGHFSLEVTSPRLVGRSMLERQRLVYAAITNLMQGDAALMHAIDSMKTRTPAGHKLGFAGHGWPRAIDIQQTNGVRT